MKTVLAAAALLALAALPAQALAASVEAVQPWSRPAAAGGNGAGFVTLMNRGKADALVGAESPAAGRVEMHTSSMAGGVMRMSKEDRVPLPAGAHVSFAPGGRHLMFIGLKQPLRVGDRAPVTMKFASGATLKVDFLVQTTAPEATDHHMH